MDETNINGALTDSQYFFKINQQLHNWDLSPVEGRGLFADGMRFYGHIQLKIYRSSDSNSKMIWNLTREQLPDEWQAKPGVVKTLEFFVSYLKGISGESIPLTFEITDGSYHPVDSQYRAYVRATIYALVDCFDKNAIPFKEHRVRRTKY